MKYGIKETKEALTFALALQRSIVAAMTDGKISIGDFYHFLAPMRMADEAIDGIEMVLSEIKDMDEAEAKALSAQIKSEFDIANDELEHLIETSVAKVLELVVLIKSFKNYGSPSAA